jgi:hypothetical protein
MSTVPRIGFSFRRCHLFPLLVLLLLGAVWIFPAGLQAESIGTFGDCDVCPGTLHLTASDVRPLLDTAGMGAVRNISRDLRRIVKLDVDGKTPEGNADSPDAGYEIVLQATNGMVFIRSLVDRSYIHLLPDAAGANRGGFIGWNPEMYLQAGVDDRFDQRVSVDIAWEKVQKSHVYQWATNYVDGAEGAEPLGDRLRYAVKRLAP